MSGEFGSNSEINIPNYTETLGKLVNYLQRKNPDLLICLGESVIPELMELEKRGLQVTHLNTKQGHELYQIGSADEQASALLRILGDSTNPIIVEDVIIGGGKLDQLRNTFNHAGKRFQAVVLAADSDQKEADIDIISIDSALVDGLRKRSDMIRKARHNV